MSKFKKILIGIAIFIFVIVISFVGTLFWLKSHSAAKAEAQNAQPKPIATVSHVMSELTSNVKDSNAFFRADVDLKIRNVSKDDTTYNTELTNDDNELKAIVLSVLRSKTADEYKVPNANLIIGEEITKELNKQLQTDRFIATYIPSIIVK